MSNINDLLLEINTQGRYTVYRKKWNKGWWYRTPDNVQFVMLFLLYKGDSVGCVDPLNIDDLEELLSSLIKLK